MVTVFTRLKRRQNSIFILFGTFEFVSDLYIRASESERSLTNNQ